MPLFSGDPLVLHDMPNGKTQECHTGNAVQRIQGFENPKAGQHHCRRRRDHASLRNFFAATKEIDAATRSFLFLGTHLRLGRFPLLNCGCVIGPSQMAGTVSFDGLGDSSISDMKYAGRFYLLDRLDGLNCVLHRRSHGWQYFAGFSERRTFADTLPRDYIKPLLWAGF